MRHKIALFSSLLCLSTAVNAADIKGVSIGDAVETIEVTGEATLHSSKSHSRYYTLPNGGSFKISGGPASGRVLEMTLEQYYPEVNCDALNLAMAEKFGKKKMRKQVMGEPGNFQEKWRGNDEYSPMYDVLCMNLSGGTSRVNISIYSPDLRSEERKLVSEKREQEEAANLQKETAKGVDIGL